MGNRKVLSRKVKFVIDGVNGILAEGVWMPDFREEGGGRLNWVQIWENAGDPMTFDFKGSEVKEIKGDEGKVIGLRVAMNPTVKGTVTFLG